MRMGQIERNTRETRISLSWNLDGEGRYEGSCGVGFFDHMMEGLIFSFPWKETLRWTVITVLKI